MHALRKPVQRIMAFFKLRQESSILKISASALLGVYFHILLDSSLYSDMQPVYPIEINPLYGTISPLAGYLICGGAFVFALFAYMWQLTKNQPKVY